MTARDFNKRLSSITRDNEALLMIYDEYYLKLKMHLIRRFGKLIDAEDVTHDIFLMLLEGKFNSYIEYPTTWLYTIADNYVKDILKKTHRATNIGMSIDLFNWEDIILNNAVKEALLNLDEISRKIIYLHYWEGYDYQETAHYLQLSSGNVRVKVSRAYKLLKTIL